MAARKSFHKIVRDGILHSGKEHRYSTRENGAASFPPTALVMANALFPKASILNNSTLSRSLQRYKGSVCRGPVLK